MEVVLNEDVKKLGYRGEVVNVKNGYFRNFLFPRKLADVATPSRLKVAESRKEKLVMKKQQVIEKAGEVLKKLKGLTLIVKAKATEKGKLYAGVTEDDLLAALKAQAKLELQKDFVKMEHFKEVGEYEVTISLSKDATATVKVVVEAE